MKFRTMMWFTSLITMVPCWLTGVILFNLGKIWNGIYFILVAWFFFMFPFIYCKLYEKKHGKHALQKLLESEV